MELLEQANEPSARTLAARANGAMSRGPTTEAGKAISSRNAVKHGFRSEKIFAETPEEEMYFQEVRLDMLEEMNPVGAMQCTLAERYIVCNWREVRVIDAQNSLLNECFKNGDSYHAAYILEDKKLATLHRYERAYRKEMRTCLKELRELQEKAAWAQLSGDHLGISDEVCAETNRHYGEQVVTTDQPHSENEHCEDEPTLSNQACAEEDQVEQAQTPVSYQTNPSNHKPDPQEILNWNDPKVATKKSRFGIANKY